MRYLLTLLACLAPLVASAQTVTHGMTIPAGEPVRIYLTTARLSAMTTRYNADPSSYAAITPSNDAVKAVEQAMLYQIGGGASCAAADGGNVTTCGDAVAWVIDPTRSGWFCGTNTAVNCSLGQGNNYARWSGEYRILAFIWLWDRFSAGERSTIISDINSAIATDLARTWGAASDPFNNYNWGFTRNAILWSIATYNVTYTHGASNCSYNGGAEAIDICSDTQTQIAETFLDSALTTRLDAISTYMDGWLGGTPPDGTHYGKYLLDYMTVPLQVMDDYGRDETLATDWWMHAAWRIVYGTTPKTTTHTAANGFAFFSHGDQQDTGGATPAATFEVGDFMTWAVTKWDGTALEGYIRHWLTNKNPQRIRHVKLLDADLGAAGTDLCTSSLPTDYFSTGPAQLYLRDAMACGVGDKPTVFMVQLGRVDGSHQDADGGSWQAWRNGQWLSKEAATYATNIADETGAGAVEGSFVWAHNGTTIANFDYSTSLYTNAITPLRVTRTANYAHGATRLIPYSGVTATVMDREFIWVPALDTLVVRTVATRANTATPATDIVHCPTNPPAISAGVLTCTVGSEVLRTIFLSDSVTGQSSANTEIDESGGGTYPQAGSRNPQYRIQHAVTGVLTTHAVAVHQAMSTGDNEVSASLSDDGTSLTVTLTKSGADTVVLVLPKAGVSTGGTIAIGGGAAETFRTDIQGFTLTTTTPAWEAGAADTTAPVVAIDTPTAATTYGVAASPLATLAGTCSDAVGVASVAWTNDRGGSGTASGTTTWTTSNVALASGANVLTVTCTDTSGNTHTDALTVTYTVPAVATPVGIFFGGFRVQ